MLGMVFILLAAVIWGVTDPLLKHFSKGMTKASSSFVGDLRFLFLRPKYLLTQVINMSGSFFFFVGLRDVDVAVASMVANSLAFVITVLMSSFIMKEGKLRPLTLMSCGLVVMGTTLCGLVSLPQQRKLTLTEEHGKKLT